MNNSIAILALALTTLGLAACNDSDKKKVDETAVTPPINAVWHAPAYGIVSDVSDTSIKFYQVSENYCHPLLIGINRQQFVSTSELSADEQRIMTTIGNAKSPGIAMERLNALPDNCVSNLLAQAGDANYQFNAQLEFDVFWETFNEFYAFFDLEDVDWDATYQIANNYINDNTSLEELLVVMTQMITPLKDFHVDVTNESVGVDYSVARKQQVDDIALIEFMDENELSYPLEEEQSLAFSQYLSLAMEDTGNIIKSYLDDAENIKSNDDETVAWSTIDGEIGYVYLESMEMSELGGESNFQTNKAQVAELLDEVVGDLVDAKGIILDLRLNPGGDDEVSQMLMSRLITQEQHVYSKQARLGDTRTALQKVYIAPHTSLNYSGPVVVLVSSSTSSAAEIFSLAMQARENTYFIGEATGGGLSDTLPRTLPSGTQFTLSNEYYISINGNEYEGEGIPVNLEVPFFRQEQRDLKRDFGIEAAIEWLNEQL